MASAERVTPQTPLLAGNGSGSTVVDDPAGDEATKNESLRIGVERDLHFYDPASILDIPREVAFGYLILLTGGATQYEAPTMEEATSFRELAKEQLAAPTQVHDHEKMVPQTAGQDTGSQPVPTAKSLDVILDDESTSLAYAAIVDGNLLHSCFGLKATYGDSAVPTLGERKKWVAVLCCFPASSVTHDALHSALPNVAENQLRMQKLVDVLREVRDLHQEQEARWSDPSAVRDASDASKASLYAQVIQGYVQCFISILRYHDMKKNVEDNAVESEPIGISKCCSDLICQLNCLFSKPKIDPELELLRQRSLVDVEVSFRGLKRGIWDSLENSASVASMTGPSKG